MNKTLENYIEEICSTEMPDNHYPAFTLFKNKDSVQAQLTWGGIDVITISSEEDDATEETILAFTSICAYLFERR